jgi:metallo-beta-lactamase class B
MIKQPQVFGKAGVFSPAFWTAPAINALTDSLAAKVNGKFFFYMGAQEGGSYVNDMLGIQELLGEKSGAMIYSVIDDEGMHNEKAWRKWFAEFYSWIMAEGFNKVMPADE